MDLKQVWQSVEKKNIEWKKHALARMIERGITRIEVKRIIKTGIIIENYSHDQPYPSALLLGNVGDRALHAVISYNEKTEKVFVITVYEPDPDIFCDDFKTRRDD